MKLDNWYVLDYYYCMVIMGIDPGTATTGWGVIDVVGGKPMYIKAGTIATSPKETQEARLVIIYDDLMNLFAAFKPTHLALEQLFFNTNTKTALLVGQARGVAMLASQKQNCPIFSYTPLQVKMAISGYGRADKKQVQQMVKTILKLSEIPKPDDAADALAVAITHSFSYKIGKLKMKK